MSRSEWEDFEELQRNNEIEKLQKENMTLMSAKNNAEKKNAETRVLLQKSEKKNAELSKQNSVLQEENKKLKEENKKLQSMRRGNIGVSRGGGAGTLAEVGGSEDHDGAIGSGGAGASVSTAGASGTAGASAMIGTGGVSASASSAAAPPPAGTTNTTLLVRTPSASSSSSALAPIVAGSTVTPSTVVPSTVVEGASVDDTKRQKRSVFPGLFLAMWAQEAASDKEEAMEKNRGKEEYWVAFSKDGVSTSGGWNAKIEDDWNSTTGVRLFS